MKLIESPSPLSLHLFSFAPRTSVLCMLSFSWLLTACDEQPPAIATKPQPVKIARVTASSSPATFEYAAEIKPRFETTLSFRVPGKIAERLVNLGDSVKDGMVVARLDQTDLRLASIQAQAAANQAQAQATLAADDLARFRELFARDMIAKAELQRRDTAFVAAKAQADALKAAAQQAANAVRYGALTVEKRGIITDVMAEAGQVVTAGQAVVKVAQLDQLEAAFSVPETQIQTLAVGQSVAVRVYGTETEWQGRIREIAGMTDIVGRTYAVRVRLDDPRIKLNGGPKLGMSAVVLVSSSAVSSTGANRSVVPLTAIVGESHGTYVLVVQEGKAHKRLVKLQKIASNGDVDVTGVAINERVIATGAQFIVPGTAISPIEQVEAKL